MLGYFLTFVVGLLLGAAITYITELRELNKLEKEAEARVNEDRRLLREIHRKLYSIPEMQKEK